MTGLVYQPQIATTNYQQTSCHYDFHTTITGNKLKPPSIFHLTCIPIQNNVDLDIKLDITT